MTRKPRQKAAKTTVSQLQSPTARLKLTAQTRPYFVKVADAAWLGYRKPLSGPGSWVVRSGASDGKGWEKTLWTADDNGLKPDGDKVLGFSQARIETQKLAGRKPGTGTTTMVDADAAITLDEALKDYELALKKRGANTYNARMPRRHLSDALLSKPFSLISETELEGWRDGLLMAAKIKPATINRLMGCVRAALTEVDNTRIHIWRNGLKALPDASEANNVVIPEEGAKAQAWVAQSYALDHALGLLTHTLGESGARPSQAVRLKIRDLITVDMAAPRLMMPKSGKGGTRQPGQRKVERYPVSISTDLAKLLKLAAKGRPSHAPLLLQSDGQPWNEEHPSEDYRTGVRAVVEKVGLDPNVYGLYAFRHTSITRMLLAGTHTAIVAKCHDTSEAMIRKHYAASILDFTDKITRETLPSLGPMEPPPQSNVVTMKR